MLSINPFRKNTLISEKMWKKREKKRRIKRKRGRKAQENGKIRENWKRVYGNKKLYKKRKEEEWVFEKERHFKKFNFTKPLRTSPKSVRDMTLTCHFLEEYCITFWVARKNTHLCQ